MRAVMRTHHLVVCGDECGEDRVAEDLHARPHHGWQRHLAIGLAEGQRALVKTEFGESEFTCQAGKVPPGMIFIPYGPPTCLLMGGDTGGTGMPTSKGWEVEVVPL